LGSSQAHFTLEGHEKGVNYVDYFAGGEKPYLISAADDQYTLLLLLLLLLTLTLFFCFLFLGLVLFVFLVLMLCVRYHCISLVKVWDYQTKTCVATLEGHTENVSAACFHPELPLIIR
jgi:coatomer subunit beta'